MSTQMNLVEGCAYFDVDYSDEKLIVPNIHTYIFVGKNLLGSDKDRYYFQTPDCYFKHGPFNKVTDEAIKEELEIMSYTEVYAAELHTIQSLMALLESKGNEFGSHFGRMS